MRLIDAERYRKEFLNSRDFEPMKILDFQPTIQAIVIPDNATNGDMLKAMFPNVDKYHNMLLENHSKNILFNNDWWNAPYKEV